MRCMLLNEEELVYWIWLTQIRGVGPVHQHLLLNEYNSPKKIYTYFDDIGSMRKILHLGTESYEKSKELDRAERILKDCKNQNIQILTENHSQFPEIMKKQSDLPVLLYYKGKLQPGYDRGIAVIGARRCTQKGKQQAIDIAGIGNKEDTFCCVVSGMAKGIDSYAHTAALKNGRYTVAVLGNGLDLCYPAEHRKLMEEIAQKGTLISEYPPKTKPTRYTFPMRNRIIAALAKKIYVIDAKKNSGTRSTVQFGRNYGCEILEINNSNMTLAPDTEKN